MPVLPQRFSLKGEPYVRTIFNLNRDARSSSTYPLSSGILARQIFNLNRDARSSSTQVWAWYASVQCIFNLNRDARSSSTSTSGIPCWYSYGFSISTEMPVLPQLSDFHRRVTNNI